MGLLRVPGTLSYMGLVLISATHSHLEQHGTLTSKMGLILRLGYLAADLFSFYPNKNGSRAGLLPLDDDSGGSEYWWWQSGPFWGTYIDYWHLTGNDSYNEVVTEGILNQTGSYGDFLPASWANQIGNDEQCIWALATMSAAEYGFLSPDSYKLGWLYLSMTVFDEQARLWDVEEDDNTCNGGLRWQQFYGNVGYDYKNRKFLKQLRFILFQ